MKNTNIKTIIVKCLDWKESVDVDSSIFDDIYMEAATQAIERKKDTPDLKVTVILECWNKVDAKDPNKHFGYNTYFVLINAGYHMKAELLRKNFMKAYKMDLQKESLIQETNTNGRTTTTTTTNNNSNNGKSSTPNNGVDPTNN